MVSYQQLEREPVSSGLFKNRIRTLESFHDLQSTVTAFIALDTEHFAVKTNQDRVLHQVGIAYMKSLPDTSPQSATRLQDFYTLSQAQVLTIDINISDERREEIIRIRGGIPSRRPHRFGQQRQVKLEDLETILNQFVQAFNTEQINSLVLVGFGMASEWEYLFRDFPKLIPYFSAWLDLRDIGQAITPIGALPGLMTTLQILGYSRKDLKPGRHRGDGIQTGTADTAGDDVIATLALALSFLQPANQAKLRFRQACGQIAGMFTKKTRNHQFQVTLEFRGHPLPRSGNSGVRLARMFFDFSPSSAGITSADMAYLTFASQGQLDRFIQHADSLVLPTGELLSVNQVHSSQGSCGETKAKDAIERKAKQISREERRAFARGRDDELYDLGGLFD